jgi:ferredoxin
MKVTIDQDKCVASGQCVTAAMEVFDQRDEDGIKDDTARRQPLRAAQRADGAGR